MTTVKHWISLISILSEQQQKHPGKQTVQVKRSTAHHHLYTHGSSSRSVAHESSRFEPDKKGEMINFLVDCSGTKETGRLAASMLTLARSMGPEKEVSTSCNVNLKIPYNKNPKPDIGVKAEISEKQNNVPEKQDLHARQGHIGSISISQMAAEFQMQHIRPTEHL
ncbi:hypothetical protein STEG23_023285 [Scotinomys teguina]